MPRIFEIPVRRQHLFEDSHRAIMSCKKLDHLKARLWVKFDGEKGLDYGGVSRYVLCLVQRSWLGERGSLNCLLAHVSKHSFPIVLFIVTSQWQ